MQESGNQPSEFQQPNLFAQTHSLFQIYQKYVSSCSSQSEKVDKIKGFINIKVANNEPFTLMIQIAELLRQEGRQLSKTELLFYVRTCQQILKYQQHIQREYVQEKQPTKSSAKESQQLIMGICLDTIRMIYFDSKKSWITTSQPPQMKFQFKCLLFELLNEVINFIQSSQDKRGQIKLAEFVELLRYNNLIDNLLTNNMHIQILKKTQNLLTFGIHFNIISEKRLFGLVRNYLKKSIEEKRVAEQILQSSIRLMRDKTLVKCLDFIVSQVISMEPQFIEDSTVSCLGTFVETIIRWKQDLIKNYEDQKRVYEMMQKMRDLSDKIIGNDQIKRRLNQLYYDCVNKIFINPEIKKKIIKQFHQSLKKIVTNFESYCLNDEKLSKQKLKTMNFIQINNSIIQLADNLINFIGSHQCQSLEEIRNQSKSSSISETCRYLFEECIINELIFHALYLINDFTMRNNKQIGNDSPNKIYNHKLQTTVSISKLLELLKYIITSGQLQQTQVKQQIQRVFTIIQGSMEFLQWVMGFSDILQDQIFTSIFNNSIFGHHFRKISFEGFMRLFRKFLELNYENNNFLIVYYSRQEGIRFKMKKSTNFASNMVLQGRVIQVCDDKLMDSNEILQVIGIKVVMPDWLGVGFMVMLGWYTDCMEIKKKILSLLVQNRHLRKSTTKMVLQSQLQFIKVSIEQLKKRKDQLKKTMQINLQPSNNHHKHYKYIEQMKGIIINLRLFIQQTLSTSNNVSDFFNNNNLVSLGGLMSIDSVEVSFVVYQGWDAVNVEELYRIALQRRQENHRYDMNQIMGKLFTQSSSCTKKLYKVNCNSQNFIKDCICLLSKDMNHASQLHLNKQERQQLQLILNPDYYLCFSINNYNNNREGSINYQTPLNMWTKLNQYQDCPRFCLIDKPFYQLLATAIVNSQCNNNVENDTALNYIVQRLVNLMSSAGLNAKQLIQQVTCYWSSLQHYQIIRSHLQQLIQSISSNNYNVINQQQQLGKYTLYNVIRTHFVPLSSTQSDKLIYVTFLIQLQQIVTMLFQQKYLYEKQLQSQSSNELRLAIEKLQNYQLLMDAASLTQQLHLCKQPTGQINLFNQLHTQIANLLNVLTPCVQWMTQPIDENLHFIIKTNIKLKQYLLRITLHKLIQSSNNNEIALWKQKHYSQIIVKMLQQLVLGQHGVSQSLNTQIVINLLLQHIVVDLSSQHSLKEFNSILENVFHVRFPTLQMQLTRDYTDLVLNELLTYKFVLILSDSLLNKTNNYGQKVKNTMSILLYQYLYLSSHQKYFTQMLIYILDKRVLSVSVKMYSSQFKGIKQRMCIEEYREQVHMKSNSIVSSSKNDELFMYFIHSKELIDQQTLKQLIHHLINKIRQSLLSSFSNDDSNIKLKPPQPLLNNVFISTITCTSSILLKIVTEYCQRYGHTISNQNSHHQNVIYTDLNNRVCFLQKTMHLLCQQFALLPEQLLWVVNQQEEGQQHRWVKILQVNTIKTIALLCRYFQIKKMVQEIDCELLMMRLLPSNNNNNQKLFIDSQVRTQAFNLLTYLSSISSIIHQDLITNHLDPFSIHLKQITFSPPQNKISFKKVKVGLHNYGNTCYINSLIQLLFSIPILSHTLISSSKQHHQLSQTTKQLKNLFTVMEYSNAQSYEPYQFISSLQSLLNLTHQQDTTEFFHILQNQLQKSHLDNILKPLQGTTETTIICQHCYKQKINSQPFLLYNLEIKHSSTLQVALVNMSKEQIVDNYKCPQCKYITKVKKHTNLHRTPQFLFIQLKRISYDYNLDKSVKIHSRLEFPEMLDLSQIIKHAQQRDNVFELFGIIVHLGSGEQGHYYSYVRENNDGRWVCCNDTLITLHDSNREFIEKCYGNITDNNNDVQWSENAYILVYRKIIGNNNQKMQWRQQRQPQKDQEQSGSRSLYIMNFNQHENKQSPQQNSLIKSIQQQNHNRLVSYLFQNGTNYNKNLFANFVHQLLIINHNGNHNVLHTLELYMNFSFVFVQAHMQGIEFFLIETKSLLIAHLHLLKEDHLFQWFPKDLLFIENNLLLSNSINKSSRNDDIKRGFLQDIFLIILKKLLSKNKEEVFFSQSSLGSNRKTLQIILHEQQQQSLQLSQNITFYLQYIFSLIPKFLLSISTTTNQQQQSIIKLYNLIKICNFIIDLQISDGMIKQQFYNIIFAKMSFSQFLAQYIQIPFNINFNQVDKEIFKFIIKIFVLKIKDNNRNQGSSNQSVRMQKFKNIMKLQQEKESYLIQFEDRSLINNELILLDKSQEIKQVLVSNPFWYKVTTIIENQSLYFERQNEESLFVMLLPVFNFGLRNSYDLGINLGRYLKDKLQEQIEKISEGNTRILYLAKWLGLLKILLTYQTTDQIMCNLQHFASNEEYKLIEYKWNSLLRVRVENDVTEHILVSCLKNIEREIIRMCEEILILNRGKNEKMETEEDLSVENKKVEQQLKQQLENPIKEKINCFVGDTLKNYLNCLKNYLNLILDTGHFLSQRRLSLNQNSNNNFGYFPQKSQLSMYLVQKHCSLIKFSQRLQLTNNFSQFVGKLIHNLLEMKQKLGEHIASPLQMQDSSHLKSRQHDAVISRFKQTGDKISEVQKLMKEVNTIFDEYGSIIVKSDCVSFEANKMKDFRDNEAQTSELQVEVPQIINTSYSQHQTKVINIWQKRREFDNYMKGVSCQLKLIKPLLLTSSYLNLRDKKNQHMIEIETESQVMEMIDDVNNDNDTIKSLKQNEYRMILEIGLEETLVYKMQKYQFLIELTYHLNTINSRLQSLSSIVREDTIQNSREEKKFVILTVQNISKLQSSASQTEDKGPLTIRYLQQQSRLIIQLSITKIMPIANELIKVVPTNVTLLQQHDFNV